MNPLLAPRFPFDPARVPFFYGWWILVVTTVGMLASIPGQTMGVGVFTEHLLQESGLGRLEISMAYMVGTIASSLLIPLGGRLLDQWGSRVMIVFAGVGLAGALFLLRHTATLLGWTQGAASLLPATWVSLAVLSVLFLLLRQFGQGLMTMVSRTVLSKWFDRRRGLATGLNGVLVSFGFSSAPLLLNTLIQQNGPAETLLLLAVTCGLGIAAWGWLFFRDQPEDCGLLMDGESQETRDSAPRSRNTAAVDVPLEDVRRSYTFWIFTLGMASSALIVTGFTFHIASIGEHAGLSRQEIYSVFVPISVISVGAHFLSGWLSDRIPLKYLLMVLVAMLALGSLGILHLETAWGRVLLMIGYGVQGGVWGCLSVVAWPRFYGRKYLGAISGLFMGVVVFSSAIGPAVFGLSDKLTGSYAGSAWAAVALNLLLFLGAFRAQTMLTAPPAVAPDSGNLSS